MKKLVTIIVTLALVTVAAQAVDVAVTYTSAPTAGLTGYTTYTVSLDHLDNDGVFTSFGVSFDTDGANFNQIPFMSFDTTFEDWNTAIDFAKDTQFAFNTATDNMTVISKNDATNQLAAVFALNGGITNPNATDPVQLAQLVMADGASAVLSGTVNLRDASGQFVAEDLEIGGTIPEPSSMLLLSIGGVAALLKRRSA